MKTAEITRRLLSVLERQGFRSAIISAAHVSELRETIKDDLASGSIDEGVHSQYSDYFSSMMTENISWARSIIAVAAPQPVLEAGFIVGGKRRSAIIPPTYDHGVDDTVNAAIESELRPHGYRVGRATLPLKLLATRSGLARYGRNNITYVEGFGSFHRLLAFYTDLPTVKDSWQNPMVLDECSRCRACVLKCPTGAIDPDEFQLRANRCLTYHNESTEPFSEWIDASWHHCLIGCMRCQMFCPANRDVRLWREKFIEFTDEESIMILSAASRDELPEGLISKFENTDLLENMGGLSRNLKSVLS